MKILTVYTVATLILSTLTCPGIAGDLRTDDPGAYARAEAEVFAPLFKALKEGDVSTIEGLLDADLFRQYRVLLEQNEDYPQYLRDYYRGATFEIQGIESDNDRYTADVHIQWPDGKRIPVLMSAKKRSE